MPTGTRSQQPQLENPLTPSRERTQRPKKPTSRQAFVAQQLESNKRARQRDKDDQVIRYAETAGEHPNSKVAREARAKHQAKLAERLELHRVITEEEDRKKALWEAEVAQFGKEEAKRRRRLVLEMRKEDEQLHTSEAEELMYEERIYPKGFLQDFDVYDFESFVYTTAEQQQAWKQNTEIQKIMTSVKAKDSRSVWEYQQISEFSTTEWDKVHELITQQASNWKYELRVRLEVFFHTTQPDIRRHLVPTGAAGAAEVSIKRPHEVIVSSDPVQPDDDDDATPKPRTAAPTKKQRLHRSGQLIEQSRRRAEENTAAGKFKKAIVDRWQCHNEHCTNNKDNRGFCFVDYSRKHYAINAVHHARWAKAIEKGVADVSMDFPPADLYNLWVHSGEVT
ncbi:MAG: hypothetical protein L6R40_008690 [Gallowayella cf. fulva]|nr:MAG: hypothetical protein L6R40_008690 [Xanthomendoza cf. fulva]